jgi:hypothetical protein
VTVEDGNLVVGHGDDGWRVVIWLAADTEPLQVHVLVQGCTACPTSAQKLQSSSVELALPLTTAGAHIYVGQARIDAGEVPYVPLYSVPRDRQMQVHELIWQTFRRWVLHHADALEGHLLSGTEPSEPGVLSERWLGLEGETA